MTRSRPAPTDDLRAFWERLEGSRERTDAQVTEVALAKPMFARLAATIPVEIQTAQRARTRELQRRALLGGAWTEYLADLHEQGRTYADLGLEFADWYDVQNALRTSLLDDILPADATRMRAEIFGMNAFLDRSMAELGAAYLEAKQDQVRRTESHLQLYIDAFAGATMGMVIYYLDGPGPESFRLVACNPSAIRESPVLATSLGRTLGELAPELLATGAPGRWHQIVRTGVPATWTQAGRDSQRQFEVRGFALPRDHVCLLFDDVTERRQLERTVARQVSDLERSNRELDEFAYVTSHDLRAPLQDVRNLADWIRDDAGESLPDESRRHLGLLQDRIGRMERLLDDLLDYSRVGRAATSPTRVTFGEVVDEVLALAPPPEGSQVSVGGRDIVLDVPRAPLEKVLRNLVSNAIKHHDRSTITLAIDAEIEGERVVVGVTDDGPGIAPVYHDRVFRMFQTLRPRDEVEASGVGLAIVKKAVELHGGKVTVVSSGRGTTMRFDWPRAWGSSGAAA